MKPGEQETEGSGKVDVTTSHPSWIHISYVTVVQNLPSFFRARENDSLAQNDCHGVGSGKMSKLSCCRSPGKCLPGSLRQLKPRKIAAVEISRRSQLHKLNHTRNYADLCLSQDDCPARQSQTCSDRCGPYLPFVLRTS